MPEAAFVYGASGHGKVVIDTLRRGGSNVAFVIDDDPGRAGNRLLAVPVAGGRDVLLARRQEVGLGIVAIGSNPTRRAVADWLKRERFDFTIAIDPSAAVSAHAKVGVGTLVMAHAVINADSQVGEHSIINTSATVDHDCVVGDFVHLAPGVHLCGGVGVGAETLIGVGAVVLPGVRVGKGCVIGAGSVVIEDIPDGMRAAGNPCRSLEYKK